MSRTGKTTRRSVLISSFGAMTTVALPKLAESRNAELRLLDRPLLDSRRQRVHFVRDLIALGPVVLSFTFTGCTVICPTVDLTIDASVREFEQRKLPRPTFATLTLDPLNDGPAELAERAEAMSPERVWLTGAPTDVYAILDALGVALGRLEDHDLAIFVIADAGRRFIRLNGLASVEDILAAHARVIK
ncbi:MAG: SCO family protein [Betaproteobacteria bacterium]|jgi:protein SCO1/2|nr:SCO family protein [Betaproteobacteria bacterium]